MSNPQELDELETMELEIGEMLDNVCGMMETTEDMKYYRCLYNASLKLEQAKNHIIEASLLAGRCK